MEFPATVEFMKNGFVRATLRLEDMPFSLYFRNTRVMLDKFKAYVVDSEMVAIDKALVIDRLCGQPVARRADFLLSLAKGTRKAGV